MTSKTHGAKQPSANNAFIEACLNFDEMIAKLQAARAEHFGVDASKSRNWAEVGSISGMNKQIASALAFIEGTTE